MTATLSEKIKWMRCERPDEWIMDEYIQDAKKLEAQNAKLQRERDDLQECFDTCYDELTATRDANDELEKEVAELREMIKSFMATNEDLNEWRFEMESTISELLAKGESNG